jgi:radical SAM superfamily enzyme YgiQ (UPF0313 family)
MSYILKLGHEARVVIVENDAEESLVYKAMREFMPAVVGLTSVSSQFNVIKHIASGIKKVAPETLVVCGGIHPTIYPDCLLETPFLDGIFIGESEVAFGEFLTRVEHNEPYHQTNNFAYLQNGTLIRNPLNPILKDLDILTSPDRSIYPYEETVRATGYAPFMFSRGCPFKCTYCSNHAIAQMYGNPKDYVRLRSPESSILEIESTLEKIPYIKTILIDDDIFGINKEWRTSFLKLYQERIRREFMCLLRVNVIDDQFLQLLKNAGCKRISFGVESGNDYIRNDVMKRNLSKETIIKAFRLTHAYGIETNAINIIGLPGEDEKMIWDTIMLNREIKPTNSCVNIFFPYRGTVLGDYCVANDLIDIEKYNVLTLERRESILRFPKIHLEKINYYYRNWQNLVYPYDIKGRLIRLLTSSPLWELLRKVK